MKALPDWTGKKEKLTILLTMGDEETKKGNVPVSNILILLPSNNMREWRNWQTHCVR